MTSKSSFISPEIGLAAIRIVVGALMTYHGLEIFDGSLMAGYVSWEAFSFPGSKYLVYTGKFFELAGGLLLTLGWYTRLGALLIVGTLSFITFVVGNGRFWYEDQHPFMFVLFGVLYFFTGPGAWSLDGRKR